MMIVWISRDEVRDVEFSKFNTTLLEEEPDFVVLSEEEADRVKSIPNGLDIIENDVVPRLKKSSLGSVFVESEDGIVKFERY